MDSAGQAVRNAYIAGRVSLGVLELIATKLPREEVSAVACPRCKVILPGEPGECSACGASLRQVLGFPAADLQAVAAQKCGGKPLWQAEGLVQAVAERYGLGGKPVQASMGFDVQQVAEEVLAVKTALENRLAEVTALQEWAAEKAGTIREYSPQAREVCRAQVRVAAAGLRYIAGLLGGEEEQPKGGELDRWPSGHDPDDPACKCGACARVRAIDAAGAGALPA